MFFAREFDAVMKAQKIMKRERFTLWWSPAVRIAEKRALLVECVLINHTESNVRADDWTAGCELYWYRTTQGFCILLDSR